MRRDIVLPGFGGVITPSPFEAFARMEAVCGVPASLGRRLAGRDIPVPVAPAARRFYAARDQ